MLGVRYVLKLCPDAFPDVLGLRVCMVCVCEDVYLYDKDENRRVLFFLKKEK